MKIKKISKLENIKRALRAESKKRMNQAEANILEGITKDINAISWRLRDILPTNTNKYLSLKTTKARKEYVSIRIEKHYNKELEKQLDEIDRLIKVMTGYKPQESFDITVEWKNNRTWGNNPTANLWVWELGDISSGSISGCGYCKGSTAVALVLSNVDLFKYLMLVEKNKVKNIKLSNSDIFGYGSGYGIIPSFSGGVGVNCYPSIFEKIGYTMKTLRGTNSVDIYQIVKKGSKNS